MALVIKNSTVGIDVPIQQLQKKLYSQLKVVWGITNDTDYSSYGRAYKNQTNDGISPEVFIGGMDYRDIYFDDTLKALSFFAIDDTVKYNEGSATSNVSLIFMVNVQTLKPSITHRADEEIRQNVTSLIRPQMFGFTIQSIVTGINNVFKEYSGWMKTTGIRYRDMQPLHCFRINMALLYKLSDTSICFT